MPTGFFLLLVTLVVFTLFSSSSTLTPLIMQTMDQKTLAFYRSIFSDLTVDREEAAELTEFLEGINPPPDKLVWLRANAFKVGCEFLTEDDHDSNVAILRTVNFIVHAIEKSCMEPKELENAGPVDMDAVTAFYKSIYDDLSVTSEESAELYAFFQETAPEVGALVQTRATAFRVACEYMGDDRDQNVQLMRCVNFVVHAFEQTCLQDKPFELKLAPTVDVAGMDLNEAVQHLWNLDANRLTPNEDYAIDVQSGKKPYWKEDSAPDPLFQRVDGSVFKRPTYKAFTALLDNYSSEIGIAERVTNTERAEVKAFLRAVMQTPCMQFCHQYCQKHGDAPADKAGFSQLLQKIWFDMYRRERGGRLDSSGFEHVFIGEARDGDVTGFHNWIQFYREEKAGNLDYRGYLKPRSRNDAETNGNDHLLTLQFNWAGVEKFAGTFFVGVSPEFELALYTLCFLAGEEENDVDLDTGVDVFGLRIKCYRMARDKIGTTFPEVQSHYEE